MGNYSLLKELVKSGNINECLKNGFMLDRSGIYYMKNDSCQLVRINLSIGIFAKPKLLILTKWVKKADYENFLAVRSYAIRKSKLYEVYITSTENIEFLYTTLKHVNKIVCVGHMNVFEPMTNCILRSMKTTCCRRLSIVSCFSGTGNFITKEEFIAHNMKRIRTTDYYKSSKSNESLERIKHVCKLKMQLLGDDSDIGVSDIEILIPMNVELDHKLEILFNETKKALAKNTTAKPLHSLWTATFAKNASICLNKHKHLFSNIDFLEFHIKKLSNQYTQTLLNPKTFPPRLRPTKVLVTNLTANSSRQCNHINNVRIIQINS